MKQKQELQNKQTTSSGHVTNYTNGQWTINRRERERERERETERAIGIVRVSRKKPLQNRVSAKNRSKCRLEPEKNVIFKTLNSFTKVQELWQEEERGRGRERQ